MGMNRLPTRTEAAALGAGFLCFVLIGTILAFASADSEPPARAAASVAGAGAANLIAVAPPPFSEDMFPCSECHADLEVNRERRELEDFHDDIVFEHDAENRWCLDCHDAQNRDKLHLANGDLLDFTESYKLCGQCHGPKLRDWRAGDHGKRTGEWDGKKEYLLCAHCHDPHSPKIKPSEPLPPPVSPGDIR